jgi:hypothetical protein
MIDLSCSWASREGLQTQVSALIGVNQFCWFALIMTSITRLRDALRIALASDWHINC